MKLNHLKMAGVFSVSLMMIGMVIPDLVSANPHKAKHEAVKATAGAKFKLSTKGDEYYFDKDKLTVKAGQPVEITFTNTASPSSALQHNWVLTKMGQNEKVATEGISAGADKGWIPQGSPDVIAHTKLLNPGQSETVKFNAPAEPGSYPYLCTFPGHSNTMKGTLQVTK